MRDAHINTRTY